MKKIRFQKIIIILLIILISFTTISFIKDDLLVLGRTSSKIYFEEININSNYDKQDGEFLELIDQNQNDTFGGFVELYKGFEIIQSFKPSRDIITKVEIFMSRSENYKLNIGNVIVCIRDSSDMEDIINYVVTFEEIPSFPGDWITLDIPDIEVIDHHTYNLVCRLDGGNNDSCYYWFYGDNSNGEDLYPSGNIVLNYKQTSDLKLKKDFAFRIYGYGDGDVERWAISMGFGFDACRKDAKNLQYILHNNSPEVWPIDHFKIYDNESNARWANILEDLRWIESREDSNDITIWQSAGHGNTEGISDDHTTLYYWYLNQEFDKFDGNLVITVVACDSYVCHTLLNKTNRIIMTGRSETLPNMTSTFHPIRSHSLYSLFDPGTLFIQHFVRPEDGGAWFNEQCDISFGDNDGWISAEEAFYYVLNSFEWLMSYSHGYLYPCITDDISGDVLISQLLDPSSPDKPDKPSGPIIGKIGENCKYTTFTTDPDDDILYYLWDWGDGTESDWIGPYSSGDECEVFHEWEEIGNYQIRVRAKDEYNHLSGWSDALPISMPKINLQETLIKFNFLFKYNFRFFQKIDSLFSFFKNDFLYSSIITQNHLDLEVDL